MKPQGAPVRVQRLGGADLQPVLGIGAAPGPGDRRGRVEQDLVDPVGEDADARQRPRLLDDADAGHRRHLVGLKRLGDADHARQVDVLGLEDRRVGAGAHIVLGPVHPGDAIAEHHLHRRRHQIVPVEKVADPGLQRREDRRHRDEERLVRARRALRDQEIGRVRREDVATPAGRDRVVVVVLGEDVDVVVRIELEQPLGAFRARQRQPRLAAPEPGPGQRGRGIAEGRRVEEDVGVQPIVEVGGARRLE